MILVLVPACLVPWNFVRDLIGIYCASDDHETLRCSRQEAVAQFKTLEQQMPYFFTLVRSSGLCRFSGHRFILQPF